MKNANNTRTLYKAAIKAAHRADDRLPHLDDFEQHVSVLLEGAAAWLEAVKLAPTDELRADHVRSFEHRIAQANTLTDIFGPGSISEQSRARTLAARAARAPGLRLVSNS